MDSTAARSNSGLCAPNVENRASATRISWIDVARGGGIILVVFGHVLRGLVNAGLLEWNLPLWFVDRWIYTFHMPLFFFMSGLFLSRSLERGVARFALGRICTIAYPYFVWSAITLIIRLPLSGVTNRESNLSELWLILYKPIGQYWFFYTLFVILLFVSVLCKVGVRPWLLLVAAVLIYPGMLPVAPDCQWGVLFQVSRYAIYVLLGMVIGSHADLVRIGETPTVILGSVGVAGLAISSLGGVERVTEWAFVLPVLAMGGALAALALAILAQKTIVGRRLEVLGRYSLEIFVAHTIASAGIRSALQKILHVTAPVFHLTLGVSAGLSGPIFLLLILRRLGFAHAFTIPLAPWRLRAIEQKPGLSESF